MRTYSISPDIYKNRSGFDDEFDNWIDGCFKSKWETHHSGIILNEEEFEEEPFDPNILKQD